MAKSDIELCNVALSTLGQRSIFSFDSADYGDNALLCKNMYTRGRKFVLSRMDWPFARFTSQLDKLAETTIFVRAGFACYPLPNLCIRPLSLEPPYHRYPWSQTAEGIVTVDAGSNPDDYPVLLFTRDISDPTKFSEAFSELLVSYLVAKLAGPVAGASVKEAAHYMAIFNSQIDSYSAGDINVGQKGQVENRDADVNTFSI